LVVVVIVVIVVNGNYRYTGERVIHTE